MECPVCFEVYRTPLLLPGCGHTICQACAELLITDGNYLRCPECRLVYQLRKGIKSLPRNVALQRTIDEHNESIGRSRGNVMCEQHPEDAVSLYCKTCEKSICLKCYFSNTLRRGESMHTGHQVDTSDDAFSKEKRLLEQINAECEERKKQEEEYIKCLEDIEEKLKDLLTEKLADIDKNRNDVISQAKQASGKLKFTLKGTIARDAEFLQMALQASCNRLISLNEALNESRDVLKKATNKAEAMEINTMKECRKKLSDLPAPSSTDHPDVGSFLKVRQFDTDLQACLHDQKKALSYQTEPPRCPNLSEDSVIVSDTKVYLQIKYNETVRVKKLTLYYKEAMYKGLSEKDWTTVAITDLSGGSGRHILSALQRGTMYRMYVIASNDCGDSQPSNELWLRTVDAEIEKRVT